MIKGKCHTNLDDYNCPIDLFAAIPNKGDSVDVMYKGNVTSLRVVSVTHSIRFLDKDRKEKEPYIKVELHK